MIDIFVTCDYTPVQKEIIHYIWRRDLDAQNFSWYLVYFLLFNFSRLETDCPGVRYTESCFGKHCRKGKAQMDVRNAEPITPR